MGRVAFDAFEPRGHCVQSRRAARVSDWVRSSRSSASRSRKAAVRRTTVVAGGTSGPVRQRCPCGSDSSSWHPATSGKASRPAAPPRSAAGRDRTWRSGAAGASHRCPSLPRGLLQSDRRTATTCVGAKQSLMNWGHPWWASRSRRRAGDRPQRPRRRGQCQSRSRWAK